jgi:hypothetical protein
MRSWVTALCLVGVSLLHAYDRGPWLGNGLEIDVCASYAFQTFDKLNRNGQTMVYKSRDHFFNGGVEVAPWDCFDIKIEAQVARTTDHSLFFQYARAGMRYLLFDELLGSPFTVTVGGFVEAASKKALYDLATPEHGTVEAEAHLAIGRELWGWSCNNWIWRSWALGAVGFANKGAGWLRGRVAVARQICGCVVLWAGAEGLVGLGERPLPPPALFTGYGPIAHRSIDGQIGCLGQMGLIGWFSFDYSYRFHAANFPEQAQRFTLAVIIPLSI